jgi:hypothetical protein
LTQKKVEVNMLTVKQLMIVMTGKTSPPWSIRELFPLLKIKALSLRSILNGVLGAKVVLFVEVRDISILNTVHSYEELVSLWKKSVPTRTTLLGLSKVLSSYGSTIKYLSSDWKRVGISGTVEALSGIPSTRLTTENFRQGFTDIGVGTGIVATIIFIDTAPLSIPALIFLFGAAIVGGGFLGVGTGELLVSSGLVTLSNPVITLPDGDDNTIPLPTPEGEVILANPEDIKITYPEPIPIGPIPAGVDIDDLENPNWDEPDFTKLPDEPPDIPFPLE